MQKRISVQEIAAAAETATTTKLAAQAAKTAYDAAPTDESLKTAYDTAKQAADDAKKIVDDLSQAGTSRYSTQQIDKMKRRRAIIDNELRKAGAIEDDEDIDGDDDIDPLDIDPDKPLTLRDLQRIENKRASKTTISMAKAITDPLLRSAVEAAINDVVPSGNPDADFKKAVAIANIEKNSKVLEELGRRVTAPQHRSGPGAPPPKEDEVFEATPQEAKMMQWAGLSKEQVIASRPKKD